MTTKNRKIYTKTKFWTAKCPALFWRNLICVRAAKYIIVIAASILSISCAADGYFEIFPEATTYISRPPPVTVYRAPSTHHKFPLSKHRYNPPPVFIYETPAVIYDAPTIIYKTYNYPPPSGISIHLPWAHAGIGISVSSGTYAIVIEVRKRNAVSFTSRMDQSRSTIPWHVLSDRFEAAFFPALHFVAGSWCWYCPTFCFRLSPLVAP